MYKRDALLKLRKLIKLYGKKIFTSDCSLDAFVSLIQFNELHENVTGCSYFDFLSFYRDHPKIFDKLSKGLEDIYLNKYNNIASFSDFSLNKLPDLLDNTIDELEIPDKEFVIANDLKKEDIVPLVNEFFKYEQVEDPEIFNKSIRDKRVVSVDCDTNEVAGFIYFDSLFNKDYICINKYRNNLFMAATCAHECGHALDVLGLSRDEKSRYVSESLFLEVNSYYIENKFYDFLLRENINKEEVKYEKLNLLFTIEEDLSSCITYFEDLKNGDVNKDIDILNSIQYGYGKSLGVILAIDKENLDIFKENHYKIFDASLLDKLKINEDKCKKVFCKELNKIYK